MLRIDEPSFFVVALVPLVVVVGAGLLFAPVRCLNAGEIKQLLLLARHVNGFGTSGFMLFTRNRAAFVLGTF